MSKYFQLTYTVEGVKGNEVRADMRKLYRTIEKIETTLVGTLKISNESTMDKKREEAQKVIVDNIDTILEDHNVSSHTTVYCSLMVDGLGQHMEFKV